MQRVGSHQCSPPSPTAAQLGGIQGRITTQTGAAIRPPATPPNNRQANRSSTVNRPTSLPFSVKRPIASGWSRRLKHDESPADSQDHDPRDQAGDSSDRDVTKDLWPDVPHSAAIDHIGRDVRLTTVGMDFGHHQLSGERDILHKLFAWVCGDPYPRIRAVLAKGPDLGF